MQNEKVVKRSSLVMGVSACALAALTGCGSTGGEAEGDELTSSLPEVMENESHYRLLAEVGLPGRTIKFFEPEEGVLLEIERGDTTAPRPSADERGLRGSALYQFLTHSYAPQALLDAERRVALKRSQARPGDLDLEEREPDVAVAEPIAAEDKPELLHGVQKTLWDDNGTDYDEFRDRFCVPTDRYLEWFDTDVSSIISKSGVNMMQAGAYSRNGFVFYRGIYSTRFVWQTWLQPGVWLGWRVTSGVNRTARSSVDTEPEIYYDHCVNYHF